MCNPVYDTSCSTILNSFKILVPESCSSLRTSPGYCVSTPCTCAICISVYIARTTAWGMRRCVRDACPCLPLPLSSCSPPSYAPPHPPCQTDNTGPARIYISVPGDSMYARGALPCLTFCGRAGKCHGSLCAGLGSNTPVMYGAPRTLSIAAVWPPCTSVV